MSRNGAFNKAGAKSAPAMTMRQELQHRQANRPKPTAEMHLTPNNHQSANIKQHMHDLNERRIRQLQARLDQVKGKTSGSFKKAAAKTQIRGDFDRSR